MINFRPATAKDVEEFYGKPSKHSFRGLVAVDDGSIVGIGGITTVNSRLVVFTSMREEMKRHKKAVAKGCRLMMDMVKEAGRPVYAVADPNEPTAEKLLAKLGFEPTGLSGSDGETLVWRE
jgi:hypothetical protein